jgi:hypothetical protein
MPYLFDNKVTSSANFAKSTSDCSSAQAHSKQWLIKKETYGIRIIKEIV